MLPVWPDGKIIFRYLANYTIFLQKIALKQKIPKVGSIIFPMRNEGLKNWQRLLNFGQSGEISPNMVPLHAT